MASALHAAIIDDLDRFLLQQERDTKAEIAKILSAANESLLQQLERGVNEFKGSDLLGSRQALLLAAENSRLQEFLTPSDTERIARQYESLVKTATEATATATAELIKLGDGSASISMQGVPAKEIAVIASSSAKLLQGHGNQFAQQATQVIGIGLANNQSFGQIANTIRGVAGGTLSRAEMIARTEVNRANNEVAQDNFKRLGIKHYVWMATSTDTCPYCLGRNMSILKQGDYFPPIHPHCRCYTIPATKNSLDFEWMERYYSAAIKGSKFKPTTKQSKWEKQKGGYRPLWTPASGWRSTTAQKEVLGVGSVPRRTLPDTQPKPKPLSSDKTRQIEAEIARLKSEGIKSTDKSRRKLSRELRKERLALEAERAKNQFSTPPESLSSKTLQRQMAVKSLENAVGLRNAIIRFGVADTIEPVKGKSAYHSGGRIHMDQYDRRVNPASFDAIYHHEYGHYIDDKLRSTPGKISSTPEYRAAINSDAIDLLDSVFAGDPSQSLYVRYIKDLPLRDRLTLQDLAGAMTGNRVGGGHSDEYYKRPGARETEAFANVVSLLASQNPASRQAARDIAPRLAAKIAEVIGYESVD